MTETTFQYVSVSKLSCTSVFTSGIIDAIGSTNGTIGATGCQYCSGFFGRQWHQWRTNDTMAKLPMVPLAESRT